MYYKIHIKHQKILSMDLDLNIFTVQQNIVIFMIETSFHKDMINNEIPLSTFWISSLLILVFFYFIKSNFLSKIINLPRIQNNNNNTSIANFFRLYFISHWYIFHRNHNNQVVIYINIKKLSIFGVCSNAKEILTYQLLNSKFFGVIYLYSFFHSATKITKS